MRPSRIDTLLQVAKLYSERSTCNRLHVGAVIAREGRILATGYNGNPAGMSHCDHEEFEGPCKLAIHAEANALWFAARYGFATEGAELYVTHAPCIDCAKGVIQAGIVAVYFSHEFRNHHGTDLLEDAGVETYAHASHGTQDSAPSQEPGLFPLPNGNGSHRFRRLRDGHWQS